MSKDCLFCRIVSKELKHWTVLEDACHVALLTPFPNTKGFTVVIPKEHLPTDISQVDDEQFSSLTVFAKKVDQTLRKGLKVERCAIVYEGTMIDHLHAKVIPMHGAGASKLVSETTEYNDMYRGFITTMEGPKVDDTVLDDVLKEIRENTRLM